MEYISNIINKIIWTHKNLDVALAKANAIPLWTNLSSTAYIPCLPTASLK